MTKIVGTKEIIIRKIILTLVTIIRLAMKLKKILKCYKIFKNYINIAKTKQ